MKIRLLTDGCDVTLKVTEHPPSSLTYEGNGLWEKLREVLAPVIGDRDLLVLEVALVLEHVGQVGRHVENVLDIVLAEHIQVGGVFGTAQVKVRQDLDGERRLVAGEGAALRLGGAARLAVRLPVGAVGADAKSSQAQDGGRRGAAGTGAVQVGFTVLRILGLELVEAPWRKREKNNHISGWSKKKESSA